MLLQCNNRGCFKSSEAKLDVETQEVICQECGKVIDNISDSMKRALKSFGQIVRSNERKGFVMACTKCRANRELALNEDNETVCKICHEPIAVTPSFRLAMEESGTKLERLITKEKEKEENE